MVLDEGSKLGWPFITNPDAVIDRRRAYAAAHRSDPLVCPDCGYSPIHLRNEVATICLDQADTGVIVRAQCSACDSEFYMPLPATVTHDPLTEYYEMVRIYDVPE